MVDGSYNHKRGSFYDISIIYASFVVFYCANWSMIQTYGLVDFNNHDLATTPPLCLQP